jgi:hypothetical protein
MPLASLAPTASAVGGASDIRRAATGVGAASPLVVRVSVFAPTLRSAITSIEVPWPPPMRSPA